MALTSLHIWTVLPEPLFTAHVPRLMFWLKWRSWRIYVSSDGSDKFSHLHSLVWAFFHSTCTKSHVLAQMAILAHLCKHRRLWQICIFAQSRLSFHHGTCTRSCALAQMAILAHLFKHRRLCQICIFAQSRLSFHHGTCTRSCVLA